MSSKIRKMSLFCIVLTGRLILFDSHTELCLKCDLIWFSSDDTENSCLLRCSWSVNQSVTEDSFISCCLLNVYGFFFDWLSGLRFLRTSLFFHRLTFSISLSQIRWFHPRELFYCASLVFCCSSVFCKFLGGSSPSKHIRWPGEELKLVGKSSFYFQLNFFSRSKLLSIRILG